MIFVASNCRATIPLFFRMIRSDNVFCALDKVKYLNFVDFKKMSQAEISLYRPILFSVAYNIVGCTVTAEDMVQDTFLNWLKLDQKKVVNVKAYLVKSVTNTCLNYLDSLNKKRVDFLENINLKNAAFWSNPDFASMDLKGELTHAFTHLFRKLAPAERAVFVLKGVFNFDYSDLPEVINKNAENCRQLFCRAQKRLAEENFRFNIETDKIYKLAEDFKSATMGEFSDLIENLKGDINSEMEK